MEFPDSPYTNGLENPLTLDCDKVDCMNVPRRSVLNMVKQSAVIDFRYSIYRPSKNGRLYIYIYFVGW